MGTTPKPKKIKTTFREGDWISVPLRDGRRALGVIAKKALGHVLLGYFFRWPDKTEDLGANLARLKPTDAVLVSTFGDAGLTLGTWNVVRSSGPDGASRWPVPIFQDRNLVGPAATFTFGPDLLTPIPAVPRQGDVVSHDVGLWGAGAVEVALGSRIANNDE